MTTTTLQIGPNTVHIHDPADTPEARAKRQERLERAVVKFWRAKEKEEARGA